MIYGILFTATLIYWQCTVHVHHGAMAYVNIKYCMGRIWYEYVGLLNVVTLLELILGEENVWREAASSVKMKISFYKHR